MEIKRKYSILYPNLDGVEYKELTDEEKKTGNISRKLEILSEW